MINLDKIIKQLQFLNELSADEKNLLLNHSNYKVYQKDKVLINKGAVCENIYFVLNGSIRVYKISSEGREVTLYKVKQGETCLMSVSCMLSNEDYPAIATVEEAIELLVVPSYIFKQLFSKNSGLQSFIFHEILVKMKKVMAILEDITFKNIDERICNYLINIKSNNSSNILITHDEIAQEIGTNRVVVSRVLKNLEKQGFLKLSRGKITIIEKFNK